MRQALAFFRRAVGLGLLSVSLLPVYRLLADPATGPAGNATVGLADATQSLMYWGMTVVIGLSLALGRLAEGTDPSALMERLNRVLSGLSMRIGTLLPALIALVLGVSASLVLFQGYPTALDEMAHLVQARFMAVGQLAGQGAVPPEAWVIQNTMVTESGWSSQYPPFHTAILSLGMRAGALWMVGPLLTMALVFFTALIARRLLSWGPGLASASTLALAASPFVVLLGAGYLSHVTAATLSAAGLWFGLRALDDGVAWALAAGLAAGALVATRPWIGLLLSGLFAFGIWLPAALEGRGLLWLLTRTVAAGFGSLPGGLWLAWYNTRLYGGPFRFGYGVLQGPSHGLGFHADPWGNAYGVVQAVGYTAADLLQLGVHLLETPIPALAVVGLYLLSAKALRSGERVLVVWALVPVAANALYWHHGHHLGPRMLYESAPAWILLTGVSAAGLIRALPRGWPARSARWAVVLSVVWAMALGVPGRISSYRWSPETLDRIRVPDGSGQGLVFVHGGWSGRLSARLAGLGMRLDSVETAIRRNDTCEVQRFVDTWSSSGNRIEAESEVVLDFEPVAGNDPSLRLIEISAGSLVRAHPSRSPTPVCAAEARADRFGVVELAPLVWQGDLPGIEVGRPMFVRDLGPEMNRRLLDQHGARPAFLFGPTEPGGTAELVPYEQGLAAIWLQEPGP